MKNIEKLYTDPSNPGSFSGIDGFLRANKNIKRSDFLNYLKNSEAFPGYGAVEIRISYNSSKLIKLERAW